MPDQTLIEFVFVNSGDSHIYFQLVQVKHLRYSQQQILFYIIVIGGPFQTK